MGSSGCSEATVPWVQTYRLYVATYRRRELWGASASYKASGASRLLGVNLREQELILSQLAVTVKPRRAKKLNVRLADLQSDAVKLSNIRDAAQVRAEGKRRKRTANMSAAQRRRLARVALYIVRARGSRSVHLMRSASGNTFSGFWAGWYGERSFIPCGRVAAGTGVLMTEANARAVTCRACRSKGIDVG